MPTFASTRSRVTLILAVVGSTVALVTSVAFAANPFVDINGNPYAGDIDATYNAGVTPGCDPTHYCPNDVVKRDQMAGFLARGLGLSSANAKRFPVSNARSSEQTFCSLAGTSPRSFEAGPCRGTALDVDSGGVGSDNSVAIGADGLPVVSYFDARNGDLKVARCTNPACSVAPVISIVDATGVVGRFSSIAIGADGLPIISYYDSTNGDLKIAHCVNLNCAGKVTTISAIDTAGDVGQYSSIAIGADGIPVVAYFDVTNGDIKVARCTGVACTVANKSVLDIGGTVGQFASVAIGSDNVPAIAYYDATNARLKFTRCSDATCKGGASTTLLESSGAGGMFSSMAIGTDGLPVIAYYDSRNKDLKVVHCGNTICSVDNRYATVDAVGDVGKYASIAIGTDGFPVIASYRADGGNLRYADCANVLCSSSVLRGLDTPSDVGSFASIAVGPDAVPVVSYQDVTSGILKVARPPAA